MNKILKQTAKWLFITYTCFISFLLTIYIALMLYMGFLNPMMRENFTPLSLANGFKLIKNSDVYGGKIITDKDSQIVVHEYVTKVKWKDNIIYGKRKGISRIERRPYYFICTYGDDCSKNQHYNKQEFDALRLKYQLPSLRTEQHKTSKPKPNMKQ